MLHTSDYFGVAALRLVGIHRGFFAWRYLTGNPAAIPDRLHDKLASRPPGSACGPSCHLGCCGSRVGRSHILGRHVSVPLQGRGRQSVVHTERSRGGSAGYRPDGGGRALRALRARGLLPRLTTRLSPPHALGSQHGIDQIAYRYTDILLY